MSLSILIYLSIRMLYDVNIHSFSVVGIRSSEESIPLGVLTVTIESTFIVHQKSVVRNQSLTLISSSCLIIFGIVDLSKISLFSNDGRHI